METNVSRCLWDVGDAAPDGMDEVALGHDALWIIIRDATAHNNLSEAWNAIISGGLIAYQILMGKIFGQKAVSPAPTAPADGSVATTASPPTFPWRKRRLNAFKLRFFDEQLTEFFDSGDRGNVRQFTLTQAQMTTILGGGNVINWIVEGRNTTAPETGRYLSRNRRLGGMSVGFVIDDSRSMTEEIGAQKTAFSSQP